MEAGSLVKDAARVYGNSVIRAGTISGEARVFGEAIVQDGAEIGDEAHVIGNTLVTNILFSFRNSVQFIS